MIGTRIEITGKSLVILWRNSPLLETKYTLIDMKDKTLIRLKKSGLRYPGAVTDYAAVPVCDAPAYITVFKCVN